MTPYGSTWLKITLFALISAIGFELVNCQSSPQKNASQDQKTTLNSDSFTVWHAPDSLLIPATSEGELILYGKDLLNHTSVYLGPKGTIAQISNGMNCQNCHINAGTRLFGNNYSLVASTYPKHRNRSDQVESIEFRINDCMKRSLNGKPLDSLSKEMRAMVAYFKWIGKDVPKGAKLIGSGIEELPFMERAADTLKGRKVYLAKCQTCHGHNGEGLLNPSKTEYIYPPLWGPNSYNIGAGLFRLSQFAGFAKNNMPFNQASHQKPVLTTEEAWDVAAFVNSQPRPVKQYKEDWPKIAKKPVDHPFGPYADHFSETQHKYGPFGPIKEEKDKAKSLK
ncbi:c-type cytochrome [Solitalea koreensis]|uniref:Thiosulfate dehydrogenase n=1 Tax=Solitalea koreensis TaxID=543615 RepID=A0A521C9W4_9SPHI|nr:c-type cytochrome [Solitalea koreensis]SMO56239.1 thiosulfate dehydrogenase [Solitalea koreensis]